MQSSGRILIDHSFFMRATRLSNPKVAVEDGDTE